VNFAYGFRGGQANTAVQESRRRFLNCRRPNSCRCSTRATGSYGISCNRRARRTTRRSWRTRDTAKGPTQLHNEWSSNFPSNTHTSDVGMASFMSGRATCARITHSWAHFRHWAVEHYRLLKHIFFVVCRPNLRETCYLTTTVPIQICLCYVTIQ